MLSAHGADIIMRLACQDEKPLSPADRDAVGQVGRRRVVTQRVCLFALRRAECISRNPRPFGWGERGGAERFELKWETQ